jgi:hypothetical protein
MPKNMIFVTFGYGFDKNISNKLIEDFFIIPNKIIFYDEK